MLIAARNGFAVGKKSAISWIDRITFTPSNWSGNWLESNENSNIKIYFDQNKFSLVNGALEYYGATTPSTDDNTDWVQWPAGWNSAFADSFPCFRLVVDGSFMMGRYSYGHPVSCNIIYDFSWYGTGSDCGGMIGYDFNGTAHMNWKMGGNDTRPSFADPNPPIAFTPPTTINGELAFGVVPNGTGYSTFYSINGIVTAMGPAQPASAYATSFARIHRAFSMGGKIGWVKGSLRSIKWQSMAT